MDHRFLKKSPPWGLDRRKKAQVLRPGPFSSNEGTGWAEGWNSGNSLPFPSRFCPGITHPPLYKGEDYRWHQLVNMAAWAHSISPAYLPLCLNAAAGQGMPEWPHIGEGKLALVYYLPSPPKLMAALKVRDIWLLVPLAPLLLFRPAVYGVGFLLPPPLIAALG